MSIITQALKKAQREQSNHRVGSMPHQLAAASQLQRATWQRWWWVLVPLGAVMALGIGFLLQSSQTPTVAPPIAMTAPVLRAAPAMLKLSSTKLPTPQPPRAKPVGQPSPASAFPTAADLPSASQPQFASGVSPANSLTATESTHVPFMVRSPRSMEQAMVDQSGLVAAAAPVQTIAIAQPPTQQRLKPEPQPRLRGPAKAASAAPIAAQVPQAQRRFRRALAAQQAGDLTQTESLLLQTIALDPSLKEAYNSLGNIYYQREAYQRAKSMYQHALEIDANYIKARNNLGSTYMRLARHTDAIDHLRQAISLDRDSGLAYYNLACVYARTGDGTQAAQYLSQAIERDPAARTWARTDTDFAPVRTAPALQKLLGAS